MDISIIHISNSNNDSTKRGTGGRGGGGEKMGLVADLNMHVGGGGGLAHGLMYSYLEGHTLPLSRTPTFST